ncbi:MAG: universal stress protein [Saprospiraceae bacterium]|nr:universal stress protein [Candidatus Defluviibacterium haderslevense]
MNKILATTDLSTNSKAGLRFAMQLADQLKCELIFYYAIEVLKPISWSSQNMIPT